MMQARDDDVQILQDRMLGTEATPSVSVIIPAYNSERYIAEAVDSVFGQTYRDFEVIVVDDGSTDNTLKKLTRYKELRVIRQDNSGPSRARNQGIRASKGAYCAFLDSDDIMLPDRLRLQVEKMRENPATGLVYCDLMTFNERGLVHRSKKEFLSPHRGMVLDRLLAENFITTSTVMAKKDCFEKVGYFDEGLTHSEDYKMWLEIAKIYPVEYVDLPLVRYRYHQGSLSEDRIVINTAGYNVVSQFWSDNEKYRQMNWVLYRTSTASQLERVGGAYYLAGRIEESRRCLLRALKMNPFSKGAYKSLLRLLLRRFAERRHKSSGERARAW